MDETIGYDFHLEDGVPTEYQCLICHLFIRSAMELPCAHAFCELCLAKWEQKEKGKDEEGSEEIQAEENGVYRCILCKREYLIEEKHPSKILDRIITTSVDVPCPQRADGCNWSGKIIDYKADHRKYCEYLEVPCPVESCNETRQRRDLEEHKATCEYRRVSCQLCGKVLQSFMLEAHNQSLCLEAMVRCTVNLECNVELKRKHMKDHRENDCLFSMIACKYAEIGCSVQDMMRKDVEEHDRLFNTKHTELLLKGFIESSNKLRQTREELVETKEELDRTKEELIRTKSEMVRNNEHAESLIYDLCCVLQQSQSQTAKLSFKETLPLLSKTVFEKFLEEKVLDLKNRPSNNFFNHALVERVKSRMKIFQYSYSCIFVWLLDTMKSGEIYRTDDSSNIYFKVTLGEHKLRDKKIFISDSSSLEHLKESEASMLQFNSEHICLFYKNEQYVLRYQIDNVHRENYKVCLCGSQREEERFWLEQLTDANIVDWRNHVTVSNEVLFRMVKKSYTYRT